MLKRILNLHNLLKKKSFFLFGPRASGKSSLIRTQLPSNKILIIDLLKTDYYLMLNERPQQLESLIEGHEDQSLVVIDEVQRVPALLNEVHRLIEERGIRFLLTGSSVRKLRQHHVNLLAGRAWEAALFPLSTAEIPNFQLERYLRYGGLPAIYLSQYPEEELQAYINTYLQQEIQIEALVRKIPAFTRFLKTAALTSGQILNFTSIASDSSLPASTIREYYHILEDTLLGFILPAWNKTTRRKATSTAKFYLFDIGVKNTLANIQSIDPQSDLYGDAFEHFIAMELRAYISYRRILHKPLNFWRSVQGHEVDFLIGNDIAIEVKSTEQVKDKHLRGLKALQEENIFNAYYLISRDGIKRKESGINIIPWQQFLEQLWNDKLLEN